MPTTRIQKIVFAFLTVFITVHLFVFYNLSIAQGGMSNKVFIEAPKIAWKPLIIAFLIEVLFVGKLANKIAFRVINPAEEKPYIITTVITCVTICLMCPTMSFVATILYDGITTEFFAHWMQKIVINFPFALCAQLFFVQPLVRFLFRKIFKKQLQNAQPRLSEEAA